MEHQTSLIIIEYNRRKHLLNALNGIENSKKKPDEVVIVSYSDQLQISADTYTFPIRIRHLSMPEKGGLPAAKARNTGAKLANYEHLIFLDVDCIPSADFIGTISKQLQSRENGIIMGTPKYLSEPVPENFDYNYLERESVFHPRRPRVVQIRQEETYELFWSLCFAITKSLLRVLSYFDEHYSGYGGEDTDLAFKARARNYPFYLSEAVVYHQQHAFYRPPLPQLENIINNCNHFYDKWGIWAMDKHLKGFAHQNLIDWDMNCTEKIKIAKKPNTKEVESCLVVDEAYG
ncbi:glycosyltransferase [Aquimarina sp. ERC-38]|uniref:glycosyltransferase family 2 protein n=1 Tax=Aquimarina sp. ERC-38 TaxID=2949996 RepID=UPI002247FFBE|nr:glycosyltransferase [Aquimarina sp. ERC-38]UZO82403.1 glycosyltransferase [Aquimarina sp. ERC-38]